MKNKLSLKGIRGSLRTLLKQFWTMLSRRFWLKLLSLLLAVLLWNYVISTNTSFTRSKTVAGIVGYVSSQSTLASYKLALVDDPTEALNNVSVRLDVPQADFSRASADNVQVTLDLSRVRQAGTQEVALKATTSYGRVVSISPSTLTLSFEALDSRSIPVNVQLTGQDEHCWYNVSRTNPTTINVSGASSVVRSISQACIYTDVTGAEEPFTRAEPYVLLDGNGEEISQTMLSCSSTSITVSVDVYPTKEIPISTDLASVVTGQVADGFTVQAVSIQPDSIVVAADGELLAGISELKIEPIAVDGLSQSFSARAKISLLSDFKYAAAEQVYVNVTIAEETVSEWIDNTSITFIGKADGLQLEWQKDVLQVYVTGPKSAVEALRKDGIPITVDLTGLTEGSFDCPMSFPTENYPDISFEPETSTISVTLSKEAAE